MRYIKLSKHSSHRNNNVKDSNAGNVNKTQLTPVETGHILGADADRADLNCRLLSQSLCSASLSLDAAVIHHEILNMQVQT